jgi:hypothetical protein
MIYQTLPIYRKSIRVIESCNHIDHIKPTKRYLNNFFKMYSTPSRDLFGPYKTFYIEDWVGDMYNRLLVKLEEKEKSLK